MQISKVIQNWILEHDDKTVFTIFYIGLSLALSIAFGLFWLVLIVFIHWVIELMAQYFKSNNPIIAFGNSLWEVKLDIALVFMALWLAVYLDFIFGIAGLGVAARTTAQLTNQSVRTGSMIASTGSNIAKTTVRFAGWQRIIRSALLSIDDVVQSARGIFKAKSGKNPKILADENQPVFKEQENIKKTYWTRKWSKGDFASVILLFIFIALILAAPMIIGKDFYQVIQILIEELKP